MKPLDVALIGEPVLREIAEPIPEKDIKSKEIQEFIDQMIYTAAETPENNTITVGLAAPQVYVSKRLFLIISEDPNAEHRYEAYINPEVEYIGEEIVHSEESCLSTPNLFGVVPRYKNIRLTFFDRDGNRQKRKFTENRAIYVQHEYDHIEGVMWVDKVTDTKTIKIKES